MEILKLENITKIYKDNSNKPLTVLSEINISIDAGKSLAILGASGSGKSTLLHIAGLLDNPTSGKIIIDGIDISALSEKQKPSMRLNDIGFIYQFHHLIEEFDVLHNIAMPALVKGISKNIAIEKAKLLLNDVGLSDKANSFPSELSGGQKQRIAIARSLINNPKVILADEPTGNLDNQNAKEVFALLIKQSQLHQAALILSTHNERLSKNLNQILTLESSKLKISQP